MLSKGKPTHSLFLPEVCFSSFPPHTHCHLILHYTADYSCDTWYYSWAETKHFNILVFFSPSHLVSLLLLIFIKTLLYSYYCFTEFMYAFWHICLSFPLNEMGLIITVFCLLTVPHGERHIGLSAAKTPKGPRKQLGKLFHGF